MNVFDVGNCVVEVERRADFVVAVHDDGRFWWKERMILEQNVVLFVRGADHGG